MHQHNHNGPLTFLVNFKLSNLNKEIKKITEDDLIGDRNMSECFKCFKCFQYWLRRLIYLCIRKCIDWCELNLVIKMYCEKIKFIS